VAIDAAGQSVTVQAQTNNLTVEALAQAPDTTVSAVALDVIITRAFIGTKGSAGKNETCTAVSDGKGLNTNAYVGGNASITAGSVAVTAQAKNTRLISTAALPNTSVSAVSGKAVEAVAKLYNANTKAYTESGTSVITDTGSVTVSASTVTDLTAGASKGSNTNISLASVASYSFLIEVLNHVTEAGIGGEVDSNDAVSVSATDSITGEVELNATTIGVFTGDSSRAEAKVGNQKTYAYVGDGAVIRARNDISILSSNANTMTATADVSAAGLVAKVGNFCRLLFGNGRHGNDNFINLVLAGRLHNTLSTAHNAVAADGVALKHRVIVDNTTDFFM
jgi:hypothetical protein